MILATISSFLGSVWFAAMCAAVGYFVGHVFPITAFKRK